MIPWATTSLVPASAKALADAATARAHSAFARKNLALLSALSATLLALLRSSLRHDSRSRTLPAFRLPWQRAVAASTVTAKARGSAHVQALRHAGNPHAGRAREGADAGPAAAARPRQGQRPVLQGVAEGRRSRRGDLARGAGQTAGAAQVHAGRGAEEEPADGRPDRRAHEQGAPRLHVARPDLRDRHRRARLFPRRAGDVCRGLPAGPGRLQHLLLSPDARRHHDGIGAARSGLRRRAGRRRQHRAAARRHRRHPARLLRRHAVVPEDPDREGGRAGQGHLLAEARLRRRRGAAAVACARCSSTRA